MTLRATVRVPLADDQWLLASVAAPRDGGLRAEGDRALTDQVVQGFRAACAAAERVAPGDLHVRASGPVASGAGTAARAAAALAGAAAASALLGLELDDARLSALVTDGDSATRAILAGYSVVVRSECSS